MEGMRRRSLIPFAVALVVVTGFAAYCERAPLVPPRDTLGVSVCASPINECIRGTVDYNPIEGGCWVIVGDNGKIYQPVGGLAEAFRQDGLRVFLAFRPNTNVAGFCPGQFVDVVALTKL